jgi:cytochrome P450
MRTGQVKLEFPLGAAVTLAELDGDPHPLLARLRAREPVSWLPALGAWLVTRRDLAVAVMRDPARFTVDDPRFSTAQVVGPSMLSLDGAEHGRHRERFDHVFGLAQVRARFTSLVEAQTERLVETMRPQGAGELRRGLAGPLAVAVIAEALGLGDAGAEARAEAGTILGWYDAIVAAVSRVTASRGADGEQAGTLSTEGVEAFGHLRVSVEASIAAGRPSSLLAAAARHTYGLSSAEVVSNAAVLMFGGIETTEGMIANAVLHLLGHPAQLALVRADARLLPNAIEESLRLEPAAAVVDRYATGDVELGGAAVRRGDLVTVSIAGANRDPAAFCDPDRFDVRRENARRHLSFAQGPHVCLGMHLARLEAQAAVRVLLDRLPGLRLDPDQPAAPRGLVFRKPPALYLRWN